MENRMKKDMYNKSAIDLRTYINGETAIKPYYYIRNGLLHVRYTVDRCVELSKAEELQIKADLTANSSDKQNILAKSWQLLTVFIGKTIISDGVAELERRIKGFQNGQ